MSEEFDILVVHVAYTMGPYTTIAVPKGWMPAPSPVLVIRRLTPELFEGAPADWFQEFRNRPHNEMPFRIDARHLEAAPGQDFDAEALREFLHEKTEFLWRRVPLAADYMRISKIKEPVGGDLEMKLWFDGVDRRDIPQKVEEVMRARANHRSMNG